MNTEFEALSLSSSIAATEGEEEDRTQRAATTGDSYSRARYGS